MRKHRLQSGEATRVSTPEILSDAASLDTRPTRLEYLSTSRKLYYEAVIKADSKYVQGRTYLPTRGRDAAKITLDDLVQSILDMSLDKCSAFRHGIEQ